MHPSITPLFVPLIFTLFSLPSRRKGLELAVVGGGLTDSWVAYKRGREGGEGEREGERKREAGTINKCGDKMANESESESTLCLYIRIVSDSFIFQVPRRFQFAYLASRALTHFALLLACTDCLLSHNFQGGAADNAKVTRTERD